MTNLRATLPAAVLLASALACSDEPTKPDVSPLGVTFEELADSAAVGDTLAPRARAFDRRGNALRDSVRFESSDARVLVPLPDGRLRAVGPGAAWVRGIAGAASDSVRVVVRRIPRALAMAYPHDSLVVRESLVPVVQLVDGVGLAMGPASNLRFSVADTMLARVDSLTGALVARAEGSVEVVVTSGALSTAQRVRAVLWQPWRALPGLERISLGDRHGCVASTLGLVYCWGANDRWQLGLGGARTTQTDPPSAVSHPSGLFAADAAADIGCGVTPEGEVRCWGRLAHAHGDRGDPRILATRPLALPAPAGPATAVTLGWRDDHCVVSDVGRALCWGANDEGAIGPAMARADDETPVQLAAPASFATLSIGAQHGCGLAQGGSLWCWGGPSSTYDPDRLPPSTTPRGIRTASLTRAVAVTQRGVCVVDERDEVWCWGDNVAGELGVATPPGAFLAPTRVQLPGRIARLDAAGTTTCALTTLGDAWCWGSVEVAPGVRVERLPHRFSSVHRFLDVSVAPGTGTICGLTTGGRVACSRPFE